MKKQTNLQILIAIILITICTGCENDKDIIKSFKKFPTSLGNQWIYEYSFSFVPYDSNRKSKSQDTTYYQTKLLVQITDEEFMLNDSIKTIVFFSTKMGGPEIRSYHYYTNENNGLLNHGHYSPGYIVFPKKTIGSFNNEEFSYLIFDFPEININNYFTWKNNNLDTIYIENPPRISLKYPLKVRNEWIFFEDNMFKIQKSINGIKEIRTAAGVFECYEIKLIYLKFPSDPLIDVTEYYAAEGLIKRIIIVSHRGTGDNHTKFELVDYSIAK